MSDLVGDPKDRFSLVASHIMIDTLTAQLISAFVNTSGTVQSLVFQIHKFKTKTFCDITGQFVLNLARHIKSGIYGLSKYFCMAFK